MSIGFLTLLVCDERSHPLSKGNMVVSQSKGTPIYTPKDYSPYDRDPQKVPLNLGNPHMFRVFGGSKAYP